jgi:D-alanyl-D-alanine carboxypeptidase/D-alanyl-D-alanine-endopeptidase (penicillin-binding protein 4)
MRRALALAFAALLLLPAGATAGRAEDALDRALARHLRAAGPATGAHVVDLTARRTLFSVRAGTPRTLASNTKLFTTAAALNLFGPAARFDTAAFAGGPIAPGGTLEGDLFLRGGGDPTFGSAAFVRREFGAGGEAEALAQQVRAAGVSRVRGGVVGDESLFDADRGIPGWELNGSQQGPVSALIFDRALDGPAELQRYNADPPLTAAQRFEQILEAAGVAVDGPARTGTTPAGAARLGAVVSPPMSDLVRLINKPSDNLLAEMLAKSIAARLNGTGTRPAGAAAAMGFAKRLGVVARLRDGSGAGGNRSAPREIAELLTDVRRQPWFGTFFESLTIAGRDGTLETRMRRGPARDRCRGKTGTLDNGDGPVSVSNLSGYCRSRGGHTLVFSFLMNDQPDIEAARRLQNRMTEAVASYGRCSARPQPRRSC